jgi:hypothetical protein
VNWRGPSNVWPAIAACMHPLESNTNGERKGG